MTVHRYINSGNPPPRSSYLENDLPSPPPKYVSRSSSRYSSRKSSLPSQHHINIKRASTAPQLPILTKATTIRRKYDYSPRTAIAVKSESLLEETQTLLQSKARFSEALPRDKPLPPMPSATEDDTMPDSSSVESRGTVSTTPTSVHEAKSSDSDQLAGEFCGYIETTDVPPTTTELDEAADLPVLDVNGNSLPFKSLYWPKTQQERVQGKRVLVIFIRHFYCGNCQEYIRHLGQSLGSGSLPPRTSIVIIGCGSPSLIPMYTSETSCHFPIYADPTKRLYKVLGMARTLSLGSKDPQYIQHSLFAGAMKSIAQGISRLPKGDIGKAGDLKQVGGEFLFEVKATQDAAETKKPGNPSLKAVQVTWCHRMRNTRDHAEIPVINDLLIPVDGHIEKPEQKESHGRPRIERRSTFDSIKRSLSVKRHSWIGRRRSYNRERSRSASRSPSRLEKAIEMPKVEDIASAPAPIETVVETREPSTPNFPNAADLDIEEQTPLVDNSDVIGKLNPDANDIQALPAIK